MSYVYPVHRPARGTTYSHPSRTPPPGVASCVALLVLHNCIQQKNLKYFIVLLSEIFPDKLQLFGDQVDVWIQVSKCYSTSILKNVCCRLHVQDCRLTGAMLSPSLCSRHTKLYVLLEGWRVGKRTTQWIFTRKRVGLGLLLDSNQSLN